MNRLTRVMNDFNITKENRIQKVKNRIQKVKNIIENVIIEYILDLVANDMDQKGEIYERVVRLDRHSFEECCKKHKVDKDDVLKTFKDEGHGVEIDKNVIKITIAS